MTEQEAKEILTQVPLYRYECELEKSRQSELFEALNMGVKALEKGTADGCDGCAFENVNEWELPCAKCKRNSKDYWRAKRGDEDAE